MIPHQQSPSCNTEKCCQIRNWVRAFLKVPSDVYVGEYSYSTGSEPGKTKSVICITGQFPDKGIFCIDKPIDEVQPSDILLLYKTFNQA